MRVFRVGDRMEVRSVGSAVRRVAGGKGAGVVNVWAVFVKGIRKTEEPLSLNGALRRAHELADEAKLQPA